MGKLGVIAGGGDLPGALIGACRAARRPYIVLRIAGMTEPALSQEPGEDIPLGRVGRFLEVLRGEGCDAVCLVGRVQRPDFSALALDFSGVRALPGLLKAAAKGDDALLRAVLAVFEREGLRVEGADEVSAGLTLPAGALGAVKPNEADLDDVRQAAAVARAIGRLDVGQAVVAAAGLVLAVEAQEGTAAMLDRVAGLPAEIRPGAQGALRGVLVKLPKLAQDRRIDLPTIGVETVRAAARAGLAGIAGEAGALLVIDRDAVRLAADEAGLFVLGLEPEVP